MTTPQLKAIHRHQQRAYQARIQFMREHGIALTPRGIIEAQREEDRITRMGEADGDMKRRENNEL